MRIFVKKKKNPEDFPFVERGRETLGLLTLAAGWQMFFYFTKLHIYGSAQGWRGLDSFE